MIPNDIAALPQGWEFASLGDVIELKYGKGLTKLSRDGGCYAVYGSNGVVGTHSNFLIENSCLVVGRKGSIGEVHVSKQPCWAIDTTYYADEFYEQPIKFWFHRLKALPLGQLNRASAIPGLNREDAYRLPIALPPLNEQHRIVAKIEALKARSQQVKEALEEIPAFLDQFRQSVLAAAFRGDLTADWRSQNPDVEPASDLLERIQEDRKKQYEEKCATAKVKGQKKPDLEDFNLTVDFSEYDLIDLPISWRWSYVANFGKVKGGKRLPKGESLVDYDTGYPYIKAGNLKNGTVITNDLQFVPATIQQFIKNYTVLAGDVYITIVGACIGDAGIIPNHLNGANLTENAAKICNISGCKNQYLALWLRSPFAQKIIQTKILSAAQGKLALCRIQTIPVPLPPEIEQIQIVKKVKYLFEFAARIEQQYREAKTYLDQLDQSILAKAFRGELVPQDPNDEPASILLERIQAERAKREAEAKIAKKSTGKSTGQRSRRAKQQDLESIQLGLPGVE